MTATRVRATRPAATTVAPPIVHDVLRSRGRPLAAHVREEMEGRFGYDFARVRVHTDALAGRSAQAVGALAYAVGHDIVFAPAQFAPGTLDGRRLLAHELTHAVQQGDKPTPAEGGLRIGRAEAAHEREAEAAANARQVPRARLTPTPPLLARQPQPPAPCALNCTDPAFLALSLSAREAQLNAQCPQGFPAGGNTFFGKTIPSVTNTTLRTKLHEAQSRAMRAMCLAGRDPNAFVLAGTIITYPSHSPAQEKAVDIDVTGQPYVMHEFTRSVPGDPSSPQVPEADIDRETRAVYDRISFWTRYRTSIIPSGITSVTRPTGTRSEQRTWRNPWTGVREPITTGELYEHLQKESTGMQGYFQLLRKSDAELAGEVEIFLMFNIDPPAELTRLGLPLDQSAASVAAFRRRIADDYRLLGGSPADLAALAGTTPSTAPPSHLGDRPFVGRRPEQGFLTMPKEIVVALTEVGLTWGAIDFAGASGDVMHIDCRGLPGC